MIWAESIRSGRHRVIAMLLAVWRCSSSVFGGVRALFCYMLESVADLIYYISM